MDRGSNRDEMKSAEEFDRLRQQAERLLDKTVEPEVDGDGDLLELIQELRLHQVELEIQNEELKQTRQELEDVHHQFADLYEFAPCAYLSLDSVGLIRRTNLAGVALLAEVRGKVLYSNFSGYLADNSKDTYLAALREAAQTGEMQTLELGLGKKNKVYRWAWAVVVADKGETDEVVGYRVTMEDISAKKEAEIALAESTEQYRWLFDNMTCGGMLLHVRAHESRLTAKSVRIVKVNNSFERLTGIPCDQAMNTTLASVLEQSQAPWLAAIGQVKRTNRSVRVERYHQELGVHLVVCFFPLTQDLVGGTILDKGERIKYKENIGRERQELQILIDERSADLQRAHIELSHEIEAHNTTKKKLQEQTKIQKKHQSELAEAGSALKLLLKGRDSDRSRLEEQVYCNINELIRPQLARLAEGNLNERQRVLLDSINNSLDEIVSPLSRKLIVETCRLTPVETQVAELIRQGKSTKEISAIMGVAASTIDYHRLNIRRRLGLTNKEVNLQSYLRSLS